jgi:hypothetical protein
MPGKEGDRESGKKRVKKNNRGEAMMSSDSRSSWKGIQETTVRDGQNSRWQLQMRRLALHTQDVPQRPDLGYFAARSAWRTFFSRLCAERVGFACSIWQEEAAKMAL